MLSWPTLLTVTVVGFGVLLILSRKKVVWTVITYDGCFFDYADYPSEQNAREVGLMLPPPVYIRRPDGWEYQLSFLPDSHITEDKITAAINAPSSAYERATSDMEIHIRDCEPCRKVYFQKVRAVRMMRSRNLPLLNLSPENDQWNEEPPAA